MELQCTPITRLINVITHQTEDYVSVVGTRSGQVSHSLIKSVQVPEMDVMANWKEVGRKKESLGCVLCVFMANLRLLRIVYNSSSSLVRLGLCGCVTKGLYREATPE